jgi:antitoxin component YwqK of YwqJK toxin-antitoxin module
MNNGNKYWYLNGVSNRLDISLPYIEMSNGDKYYKLNDGGKKIIGHLREQWFDKDGKLNREDGPALIYYYNNGNVLSERYYSNGKLDRENGPAYTAYNENGNIDLEYYYLNEKYYSKKDYLKKIKELKSCNKMS